MRGIVDKRLVTLQSENEALKKLIVQAKKKRIEASQLAEKLAESNYCLENCLAEAYAELYHLRRANKNLGMKKLFYVCSHNDQPC